MNNKTVVITDPDGGDNIAVLSVKNYDSNFNSAVENGKALYHCNDNKGNAIDYIDECIIGVLETSGYIFDVLDYESVIVI